MTRFVLACGRLFGSTAIMVGMGVILTGAGNGQTGGAPALRVMPLPRSVEMGSGELVIADHFHAVTSGDHDARLDAALERFLWRLDRQCGEIRRGQFSATEPGAPIPRLHLRCTWRGRAQPCRAWMRTRAIS